MSVLLLGSNSVLQLPLEGTYSFFQTGIRPAWEDEINARGGEVRIFFNKMAMGAVDKAWSSVLLAMVGETLVEGDSVTVCGATVSRKKTKCKIAVWIDCADEAAQASLDAGMRTAIGEELLRKEQLSLEWKSHRGLLEKEKLKESLPPPSRNSLNRSGSGNYQPRRHSNNNKKK